MGAKALLTIKIMIKVEVKKFLISFILTTIILHFISYGLSYSSFLSFFNFSFHEFDWTIILFAIALYFIGYLIFNLVYFIAKVILKNRTLKFSLLTITTLFISTIAFLFLLNDKLIYEDVKSYDLMTYYYSPQNFEGEKIDSTNYSKFIWLRETFEGSNSLIKEKLKVLNNHSFNIVGSRIIVDRLYLFRKLFNVIDTYDYNVQFEFDNSIHIIDSLNKTYSAQIRNNRLYLNSVF
mgnify:CR=1 FL=1